VSKYDIQALLKQSFEDIKIDNTERRELALRLSEAEFQSGDLAFLRNQSFAIVQQAIRDGCDALQALKWLEQVVKQLDKGKAGDSVELAESWFSPGTSCFKGIINQLNRAAATVDICVFTIADDNLTEAILKTHHRGVRVRVISDNDKVNDAGSDIDYLARKGLAVKVDNTDYHMHHKFVLFDNQRLINGSFNWTRSASRYNSEDLTLTDDRRHVEAYQKHFERLWQTFPDHHLR